LHREKGCSTPHSRPSLIRLWRHTPRVEIESALRGQPLDDITLGQFGERSTVVGDPNDVGSPTHPLDVEVLSVWDLSIVEHVVFFEAVAREGDDTGSAVIL
jgi:hypothetical protein